MLSPVKRNALEQFAIQHKLVFEDCGEVGFGRTCVGFLRGNSYVDTLPFDGKTFEPINGFDDRVCNMAPPNAYHKHACLAVLVHDENYDEALDELHTWVESMSGAGVEVVEYAKNPANAMQAVLTGTIGYAVRVKTN